MTIPAYDELMFPLLEQVQDGAEHEVSKVRDAIAAKLGLSAADRAIPQPNGFQPLYDNRFGWAKTYLIKAGLLDKTRRGSFQITSEGKSFLENKRTKGESKTTWQEIARLYPGFSKWMTSSRTASSSRSPPAASSIGSDVVVGVTAGLSRSTPAGPGPSLTPEENLKWAFDQLDGKLLTDLESKLATCDPTQFEVLISRLLVKMGYAKSERDILQLHGKTGDGGIDGKIRRDPLGLEQVYHQAKRWSSPVTLKEVTDFFEVVGDSKARTGVFVARKGFNKDAREYAEKANHSANIAWLDGRKLAELMIEFRVGIREEQRGRYVALSIDENAFLLEED